MNTIYVYGGVGVDGKATNSVYEIVLNSRLENKVKRYYCQISEISTSGTIPKATEGQFAFLV
jgi:hypothetical protein